jgi:hypothetical protein
MTTPMKDCDVCALEIPATAKVCTHCDSDQNRWVRRIKQYGLAAAGLVALFPLFDAANSLSDLAKGRNKSEVTIKTASCEKSGITLVAMNFGKGPAFISITDFKVVGPDNPAFASLHLKSDAALKAVSPSGYQTISAKGWIDSVETNLPVRGSAAACEYHVGLTVLDAYGETRKEKSCDCPLL